MKGRFKGWFVPCASSCECVELQHIDCHLSTPLLDAEQLFTNLHAFGTMVKDLEKQFYEALIGCCGFVVFHQHHGCLFAYLPTEPADKLSYLLETNPND